MKLAGLIVRGWLGALALTVSGAATHENAVQNPGFEETEASGATVGWPDRTPAYRFADGVGRGGAASGTTGRVGHGEPRW